MQQEQMVLQYVKKHGSISSREVAELCRIGCPQAYRLLQRLVRKGPVNTRVYLECTDANRRRRQKPIKDLARLEWHEVTKVAHYHLSVEALSAVSGTAQAGMTRLMMVREDEAQYGTGNQ